MEALVVYGLIVAFVVADLIFNKKRFSRSAFDLETYGYEDINGCNYDEYYLGK